MNRTLCKVLKSTLDAEMSLQATLGAEIFARYGIDGDIQEVNEAHISRVLAYSTKWEEASVKLQELARQASRCESALYESKKELKELDDALVIIQKQRDKMQEQVNFWELKYGEVEQEIEQIRVETYGKTSA